MSNKTIAYLLGAAVVIVLLLFIINPSSEEPTTEVPDATPSTSTQPLLVGNNAVYINDQRPATHVIVAAVILEKPGYAVIHNSVGNTVGTVIGNSALLPAGESKNVKVDLNRKTISGTVYYVVLHSDNGDKTFNANNDPTVTDEAGNAIQMPFTISSTLSTDGSIEVEL